MKKSMLFIGKQGVGKTFLLETLKSRFLFNEMETLSPVEFLKPLRLFDIRKTYFVDEVPSDDVLELINDKAKRFKLSVFAACQVELVYLETAKLDHFTICSIQ